MIEEWGNTPRHGMSLLLIKEIWRNEGDNMKKRIGWMFTVVGLIGLLPAVYGILVFGSVLMSKVDSLGKLPSKLHLICLFVSLLLLTGVWFWSGNIRYSFGRQAWFGNRSFWKASGFYNLTGALFTLWIAAAFKEPSVLVWTPTPVLATFLSFYVSNREADYSPPKPKEQNA